MRRLFILVALLLLIAAPAFGAAPKLFFSNMTDAPITGWGGSATKGAAVSIYCGDIGSSRGSSYVTVGGINLTADTDYAEWGATTNPQTARGLKRITFFLNSSMTTGGSYPNTNISVTTPDGTSQTIPFHTRVLGSNHIYFVSQSGSDANGATWTGSWIRENLVAGDIAYIRAGTYTQEDDGTATHSWAFGGNLSFCYGSPKNFHDGTEGNSITVAGYPGELAAFEAKDTTNDRPLSFVRFINTRVSYWTFTNIKFDALRGIDCKDNNTAPYDLKFTNMRFVGLDGSTIWTRTDSSYSYGDIVDWQAGDHSINTKFLGNWLHDVNADTRNQTQVPPVGDDGTHRSYAFYYNGYGISTNFEFAWNEIAYNNNSRGVMFFGHTCDDRIYNLQIHDNFIHDTARQGIIFGGEGCASNYRFIDQLYYYNNINAAAGIMIDDNGIHYQNDYPVDFSNQGTGGKLGNFHIFNNVIDNSLSPDFPTTSIPHLADSVEFKNNILINSNGATYPEYIHYGVGYNEGDIVNLSEWHGSNNIYYGRASASDAPNWDTSTLKHDDPVFVSSSDYHLQSASPGRDAGTTIASVTTGYDGTPRPQGSAYDIGAYELADTTGPARSAGAPTGEQSSGTISVTMSLTTDVAATCKYGANGATGVAYASLANTFTTTGGTSHSVTISGLSDGNSYSRAIRCERTSDSEVNDSDFNIGWSVASAGGSTHNCGTSPNSH